MAFPLDVYPVMSEMTELREKVERDAGALAQDADLMPFPSPQRPVADSSSLSTPRGGVGKAWRKIKKAFQPGERDKKKAETTIAATKSSKERLIASNSKSSRKDDDVEPPHSAFLHSGNPSTHSNLVVEPAELQVTSAAPEPPRRSIGPMTVTTSRPLCLMVLLQKPWSR